MPEITNAMLQCLSPTGIKIQKQKNMDNCGNVKTHTHTNQHAKQTERQAGNRRHIEMTDADTESYAAPLAAFALAPTLATTTHIHIQASSPYIYIYIYIQSCAGSPASLLRACAPATAQSVAGSRVASSSVGLWFDILCNSNALVEVP